MKRIFIFIFLTVTFFLTAQNMNTYNENNGYYKIDYPKDWSVSENLENNNQVSFYPEDESIVAGIVFGDLKTNFEAKYILDETLNHLNATDLISDEDSYATQEELIKWNADSANSAAFTMEQDGAKYSCILIIMTKGTFYYSLMFVINPFYVKEDFVFQTLNSIINSFKILK